MSPSNYKFIRRLSGGNLTQPPSNYIFKDKKGNEYPGDKVYHADIDDQGTQCFKHFTKESFNSTNCLNDMVQVEFDRIQKEKVEKKRLS